MSAIQRPARGCWRRALAGPLLITLSWSLLVVAPAFAQRAAPTPTPLDEYVRKPDAAFRWEVASSKAGERSDTIVLRVASQAWRMTPEVDREVWQHWLVVSRPHELKHDTGFLFIGGGANDAAAPERADPMIARIAEESGTIVAELKAVPNQPLVFHQDGTPRKEDDLLGYGWDQYIKTGESSWVPQLAMAKSAVRAMDALQQWARQESASLERFVVAGASKRGWTTWLTAAVDPRVAAFVPIVIDVANVEPSIRHHAEAYGFWAQAIGNYYQHQILQRWDHPRLKELYRFIDPYSYRDRLTQPKLVLNASGDQFFLPDSSQFYFQELQGERLLRYVPNADHSLRGSDATESLMAFYQMFLSDRPRPRVDWTFRDDGTIEVRCQPAPARARQWQATNAKNRDFRLMTIGPAFASHELASACEGTYIGRIDPPGAGWTAFFVELEFDSGGAFPLKLTTSVRVLPDRLPHAGVDLKTVPYERR